MDNAAVAGVLATQFIMLGVISLIYAVIVYVVCRKRRINPWGWVIGTMVPVFGFIVFSVFWIVTLLSMLDRLNALENEGKF